MMLCVSAPRAIPDADYGEGCSFLALVLILLGLDAGLTKLRKRREAKRKT